MSVTIQNEVERVRRAGRDAARNSFARTAFLIRETAIQSIDWVWSSTPSAAGTPPHTHRSFFLHRAIRYSADKEGAVIGPTASVLGVAGEAHEFGGQFRGQNYPARPFMGPALTANLDVFAGSWSGSISN